MGITVGMTTQLRYPKRFASRKQGLVDSNGIFNTTAYHSHNECAMLSDAIGFGVSFCLLGLLGLRFRFETAYSRCDFLCRGQHQQNS